jgi:hypothetical protein
MPYRLSRVFMLVSAVAMLFSGASATASDVKMNIGLVVDHIDSAG